MPLYSIKRIEAGNINPAIGEAPVAVTMIDKDTGIMTIDIVQATFVDGHLDATATLQTLTDDGYFPNDWLGEPTP